MSKEFMMPNGEPDELWLEDSELPMKVNNLLNFSEGCTEDIGEIAEGMRCFFSIPSTQPTCKCSDLTTFSQ